VQGATKLGHVIIESVASITDAQLVSLLGSVVEVSGAVHVENNPLITSVDLALGNLQSVGGNVILRG